MDNTNRIFKNQDIHNQDISIIKNLAIFLDKDQHTKSNSIVMSGIKQKTQTYMRKKYPIHIVQKPLIYQEIDFLII